MYTYIMVVLWSWVSRAAIRHIVKRSSLNVLTKLGEEIANDRAAFQILESPYFAFQCIQSLAVVRGRAMGSEVLYILSTGLFSKWPHGRYNTYLSLYVM
jgi:hypothetical protein